MKLVKRLLRHSAVISILTFIIANYMRLTYFTTSWRIVGQDTLPAGGAIYVFWHGRILMMPCVWSSPRSMYVLVSPHNDGAISNGTLKNLGFNTIRGTSSNASSLNALRHILKVLKKGENIAITPDGPRGPKEKIHSKVVEIAKAVGVPIIPMSFSSKRYRILNTWDSFFFALPFSRGTIIFDRPLHIPSDASAADVQHFETHLVERLQAITKEADLYTGVASVLS
jgi:lysophospholipid acyltransferase (LPLAT)-like uncharacterized protein